MISRKFAYADDLALLHSSGNWKDLEKTLSQDMSTLSAYLQTWRLKLSHTKTVTAAFHREAKRELKVYNNGRLLLLCPTPTYLGVKLDRSLTFRHHLVALRKKLSSRVTLLRQLVGSGWGAGAKTLRITTLSLVYSIAEYCRSAHTRLIDALRIVTECLRLLQRTTYLYSQASSQLRFAEWERHSPWLTVDFWTPIISCMVFKWVLRYSPSETKIQTPVFASCAKSFGQPCQTLHPRF